MVKFREFTASDSMGNAGAESFSNGQPPLIANVTVYDQDLDGNKIKCEGDIVVDANGVFIHWLIPDYDEEQDSSDRFAAIEGGEAFQFLATRVLSSPDPLEFEAEELDAWSY